MTESKKINRITVLNSNNRLYYAIDAMEIKGYHLYVLVYFSILHSQQSKTNWNLITSMESPENYKPYDITEITWQFTALKKKIGQFTIMSYHDCCIQLSIHVMQILLDRLQDLRRQKSESCYWTDAEIRCFPVKLTRGEDSSRGRALTYLGVASGQQGTAVWSASKLWCSLEQETANCRDMRRGIAGDGLPGGEVRHPAIDAGDMREHRRHPQS